MTIWNEIISLLRYRWKIALLAFIVTFVTGLIIFLAQPDIYKASMQLAVEQPSQEIFAITQGGAVPVRYLSLYTRASRIHTPSFAKQVAEAIAFETPGIHLREEEIYKSLHAFTNESPDLFVISSEHNNPFVASLIAKTAAGIFVEERMTLLRREAKGAREKLEKRIDDLEKPNRKTDILLIQALKIKLEELRLIEETRPADVVPLDETPQIKKITLNITHELLLLSLLGVALGIISIFISDAVDSKITRLATLRAVSGDLPCWIVTKVYGDGANLQSFIKAIRFWQAKSEKSSCSKTKTLLIVPINFSRDKTNMFLQSLPDSLKSKSDQNIMLAAPDETAYSLADLADGVILVLETGKVKRDDVLEEVKRWRELKPSLLGLLLIDNI